MNSSSKKFLAAGIAALAVTAGAVPPAYAGGYGGGHYRSGYYSDYDYYGSSYRSGHRRGGRGIGNGEAVLLGIGALGLGLVLSEAFDDDKRGSNASYDNHPRSADRGYGDRYDLDEERRRLENERARLENERLRLENEQRRRALGEGDDGDDGDFAAREDRGRGGRSGGDGFGSTDALDRDLAGGSGRLNYDRAFAACVDDARRDSSRRGVVIAAPYTWAEAQPLGAEAVRFRANLGRNGLDMVCDVGASGVTRLDLTGV